MSDKQIYSATYSAVPVYEFLTKEGPVMRRKSDGWVNATHILKVASFPKAKRTRILERDVQTGEHEKVQGGYGKYQGTWVPLKRARELAQQFNVDDVLAPIFDFVVIEGAPSPPPAPKHHHASTLAKHSLLASDPKTTKKTGVAAQNIPKKRGRPKRAADELVPIHPTNTMASTSNVQKPPQYGAFHAERSGNHQSQNLATMPMEPRNGVYQGKSEDIEISSPMSELEDTNNIQIDPSSSPSDFMSDSDLANALRSPQKQMNSAKEILERAIFNNNQKDRLKKEDFDNDYVSSLTDYFMGPDEGDNSANIQKLLEFLEEFPTSFNFDQIIDNDGHTGLHWACAMGSLPVIELLISKKANIKALSYNNQIPIMRSVMFSNCYTKRVFARICELLIESISSIDNEGKTILHHIALTTESKARLPSSRYYTEILLAKLSELANSESLQKFINLRDVDGNTALHIFSHNGAKKCIKLLLGYHARTDIPNNLQHTVEDYLLQHNFYLLNTTPRFNSHVEDLINEENNFHFNSFNSHGMLGAQAIRPSDYTRSASLSHNMPTPHLSETAIRATQKVSNELVESLEQLSNAFDRELQEKEESIKEVKGMIEKLENELSKNNENLLSMNGLDTLEAAKRQCSVQLDGLNQEISNNEIDLAKKTEILTRILERSQAKDVAKLVELEETSLIKDKSLIHKKDSKEELLQDAIELTRLQLNRKNLLSQIIAVQSQSNGNQSKMSKYRKLISLCCEIDINEVDNLLDGIEDVLKN